jgi:hypothetical protein
MSAKHGGLIVPSSPVGQKVPSPQTSRAEDCQEASYRIGSNVRNMRAHGSEEYPVAPYFATKAEMKLQIRRRVASA